MTMLHTHTHTHTHTKRDPFIIYPFELACLLLTFSLSETLIVSSKQERTNWRKTVKTVEKVMFLLHRW